jgi:hypothetical protein
VTPSLGGSITDQGNASPTAPLRNAMNSTQPLSSCCTSNLTSHGSGVRSPLIGHTFVTPDG